MKKKDIEAIFSQKVAEYLANGYTINTTTMSGHQGEIAKIDVRKGDEIVRILLESTSEYAREFHARRELVILTVGRNTDPQVLKDNNNPFDTFCRTLWNDKIEPIEQRRFYQINSRADFFTENVEAYDAMLKKQISRYQNSDEPVKKQLHGLAEQIGQRFIRRKLGKTRVSIADIRVFNNTYDGRAHYSVEWHGHSYGIH